MVVGTSQLTLCPIGVIHTPFADKASAPRQTYVERDAEGTLVLDPGRDFEHALADIDTWDYLWVLYWFHLNEGWRPKVLPPRSKVRRGVFSTRSPHRPAPLGMSVVRLVRIEGLTVFVKGVDMVDGTPLLDIKPYVATADSFPGAGAGWLSTPDPRPEHEVVWSPLAQEQAAWLKAAWALDVITPVARALALGPDPHPYRRIRRDAVGLRIAVKEWRARFEVETEGASAKRIRVLALESGYKASELADGSRAELDAHRAFATRFGANGR